MLLGTLLRDGAHLYFQICTMSGSEQEVVYVYMDGVQLQDGGSVDADSELGQALQLAAQQQTQKGEF